MTLSSHNAASKPHFISCTTLRRSIFRPQPHPPCLTQAIRILGPPLQFLRTLVPPHHRRLPSADLIPLAILSPCPLPIHSTRVIHTTWTTLAPRRSRSFPVCTRPPATWLPATAPRSALHSLLPDHGCWMWASYFPMRIPKRAGLITLRVWGSFCLLWWCWANQGPAMH